MLTFNDVPEIPEKSNRCAIVIPIYKKTYSPSEILCIESALSRLSNWDIFFATHAENMDQPFYRYKDVIRYSIYDKNIFSSVNSYNEWLLTDSLYKRFGLYQKILICQSDAYVIKDEISLWVDKDYDYIGAPWHGLLSITPKYKATPNLNGMEFRLFVGNGGFSMRDSGGMVKALARNKQLVHEFQGNEDGFFAFLGIVDPNFRLAPYHHACIFALELHAAETIEKTQCLPMGFHAIETHDFKLWKTLL